MFSLQGAHPLFEVVHGLLSRTDSAGPHSGSHAGNITGKGATPAVICVQYDCYGAHDNCSVLTCSQE